MSNPRKQSASIRAVGGSRRPQPAPCADEPGAAAEPALLGTAGSGLTRRLVAEIEGLKAELAATRAQARELAARADIDPLLEILNRRGFERELTRALAYSKRYGAPAALVYLDLDRFKQVNDLYGHAAGDDVLRTAAASLTSSVRASDVVGRLGGDEFALLLWNVTPEAAAAKAAALEQVIAGTVVAWQGLSLSVGASAGFAMLEPGDDSARVIARADRAMYARKGMRKSMR